MDKPLRILIVEDSEDDAALVLRFANHHRTPPEWKRVETLLQMQEALNEGHWDLVISDYHLPKFSGPEAIKTLRKLDSEIPLIIVSGTVGEDTAIEALKMGATDYVLKSNLGRLSSSIDRALKEHRTRVEKREAELQLQQAQKMDSIGRLAGGVAHDVNNVLAAITLFAEMAIDQIQENHLDQAKKYLEDILKAQDTAASIIRQLLVFSRRRMGPLLTIDFSSALVGIQPLITRLIGENITLVIKGTQEPLSVSADKTQLEQIVLNLVVNARDAMPQGGHLTLSIDSQQLDTMPPDLRLPLTSGKYIVLTSTDSGCGMPVDVLQHLFEPFFTTKEPGKGTGLGLSVIYGILRQANGSIRVSSIPNQGTTFQIFWPAALANIQTQKDSSIKKKEAIPKVGPLSILLVEDENALRTILAATLRKQGHTVFEAIHGEEALQKIQSNSKNIQLLITDIIMPKMGGPELAEKARALKPDLLVLFLSGYTTPTLQEHKFDPDVTWFLEKPFTSLALAKKVEEVLHDLQ